MKKVFWLTMLLVLGLVLSQLDMSFDVRKTIQAVTYFALSYIMIGVGMEFAIDKRHIAGYAKDYLVAATAAALPWVFVSIYFVSVLGVGWKQALFESRFASPTSAGVLFTMMGAAGLEHTWVFGKARILAIFDDVDTVLFMIPLTIMMVGFSLAGIVTGAITISLIVLAYLLYRRFGISTAWYAHLLYALGIAAAHYALLAVGIEIEVLLPAFSLGCMIEMNKKEKSEAHDKSSHVVGEIVSATFLVLVGLSLPKLDFAQINLGMVLINALVVTVIANAGKFFPFVCYADEASVRERFAVCVAMCPRGEVGGGVLVLAIASGFGGQTIVVAALCLALNLCMTGLFIAIVKRLTQPKFVATV
jgi:Kef-type K+ transport system membrane component KefB